MGKWYDRVSFNQNKRILILATACLTNILNVNLVSTQHHYYHKQMISEEYWILGELKKKGSITTRRHTKKILQLCVTVSIWTWSTLCPEFKSSGSGIWAIEMANAYPNCELVGIDLVCPVVGDGNLPQNCNFRTVNGKSSCLLDYKRFKLT